MKSVFALLGCLLLFVSTAPFSQADLSEGLVAYWPLDNDTKDAGDHDGILKSGAVLVDDPERGKVLDVSPNNGTAFMEVAHADDIGFVDPATRTFAISLWAKPADLPRTGWTTVFSKNRPISPADTIYGIWISPSNNWHFRVDGVAGDSTPLISPMKQGGCAQVAGRPHYLSQFEIRMRAYDDDITFHDSTRGYRGG